MGAVAGLALAIVFTWRLLRTPRGPQRRQPKRLSASSSGTSSHATANAGNSEVGTSPEDPSTQNVINEFFQPVKVDHYVPWFSLFCMMFEVSRILIGVFLLYKCSQLSTK